MRTLAVAAVIFLMAIALIGQLDATGSEPCFSGKPDPEKASPGPGEFVDLTSELVTGDLDSPSDMFTLPGDSRLYVVEKPGRIVAVDNGQVASRPVLDMTPLVDNDRNEQGLLTVAPHPDFAENCLVYLFYTDTYGDSRLAHARVSGVDEPTVDLRSMTSILKVPQDDPWHQSGSMFFGPDGYLWVSIGDGGGKGDPHRNAQNPHTFKGSVIRIDVGREPYEIPETNPFAGGLEGRPEVWAYGLRNPWRISLDEPTGMVYIPDVGQETVEELDVVPDDTPGLDFGWPIREGSGCYTTTTCATDGLTPPVFEYEHEGNGCAMVGGEVYRGGLIPELDGSYFFADFCFGWVKTLRYEGGKVTDVQRWDNVSDDRLITSFATDASGELYFMNLEGKLWKIVPIRN